MKKSSNRASEGITASEERRTALVERGLRHGLTYSAAGVVVAMGGIVADYPGDKWVLGGGALLAMRGIWVLIRTAYRVERRRRVKNSH